MNLSISKLVWSDPVVSGILSSAIVVFIWSSWIVASRFGAQSPLTVYDLAAIRFGVSGLISLPFVCYYKPWRSLAPIKIFTLAMLAGIPYQLLVYKGFELAPASHAGVFMNGMLPALTIGISCIWLSKFPYKYQIVGVVLILIGAIVGLGENSESIKGAWRGDILFVMSALLYSIFLVLVKRWNVTTSQILLCVMLVNGLIFVPVWLLVLPTALSETTLAQILLQCLFQGILATLIGLVLVAYATLKIGAPAVSAIMSSVPALAALLALLFLNETIGVLGWQSIAILTLGILMIALPDLKSSWKKA